MIASLPMYDRPKTAAANDRFWAAIRDQLGQGPDHLSRGGELWAEWQSPDLLFSQTCGYPYRAKLHGKVRIIGTPDYGLPGCAPGWYNSVLVARAGDARTALADYQGAVIAYNEPLSQSGWAAPVTYAAKHNVSFGEPRQSGAHVASAHMVAEGRADIAGIDALTWEMIQKYENFANGLQEITRTNPTPGLPYVTSLTQDPDQIFRAVSTAIANIDAQDRKDLHLLSLVKIPLDAYLSVPNPASPSG